MSQKPTHSSSSTVEPAIGSAPTAKTPPKRTARLVLLALLALLVWVSAFALPQAWRETQLREASLHELEQRVKQDSANPKLLSLTALRQAQAGEYHAASETFTQAVAAGEQDLNIWLAWAASEAAEGGAPRAGAILQYGMKRQPALSSPLKEAIQRGAALGKTASPAALADAICPGGVEPLIRARTKGSYLNAWAEWTGARNPETSGIATREKRAKALPQDAAAQRFWGEALLENRRYSDAELVLKQAVALNPSSPEAHFALGKAIEGQGNLSQAGVSYVAAVKLRPDWLPALLAMGRVAVEKQLIPIGIDAFDRAVKIDPKSAEAWIGYGRAYYNQRLRLDKALEGFEKAYQLDPTRTDYFGDYSNALRANFRMADAEQRLRQRVQAAPADARSRYLLALILLDHQPTPERESEAELQLRESLKIEPDVPTAQARLGRLLLSQGNRREAVRALETSLRLDPYNVSATLSLARAYTELGRTADAERIQRSAKALSDYSQRSAYLEDQINRKPTDGALHLALAQHYEKGGETEKAQKHLDMAYMLKTHNKEATRGLNMLRDSTSVSRPPTSR